MNKQTTTQPVIMLLVIIAGLIVIGLYLGMQRVDVYLKNQAVQGCAEVASQSGSEQYPFSGWAYMICMDDKGYETSIK